MTNFFCRLYTLPASPLRTVRKAWHNVSNPASPQSIRAAAAWCVYFENELNSFFERPTPPRHRACDSASTREQAQLEAEMQDVGRRARVEEEAQAPKTRILQVETALSASPASLRDKEGKKRGVIGQQRQNTVALSHTHTRARARTHTHTHTHARTHARTHAHTRTHRQQPPARTDTHARTSLAYGYPPVLVPPW